MLTDNFFYQYVNNFSELLLCKINVFVIFNMNIKKWIFVTSRSTDILNELNFWLGIYVSYMLKGLHKFLGSKIKGFFGI